LAIVLENPQELSTFKQRVNDFVDENMESMFDGIVIPETKRMASAMMLPTGFIESIRFEKTGYLKGKVIDDFGAPDLPLAVWFNYGTKRNYPITPKVEHPEGASPRAARDLEPIGDGHVSHPSVLHWVDESGKDHFARKVIHPGFPKTLAVEFGVQQGKKKLIEMLPKILESELSE
jgi:hypothetical protein